MAHPVETRADLLEAQIGRVLQSAAGDAAAVGWSDREWTRQVKNRIGLLPEARTCRVYATQCDFGINGEWLFDMTWVEESQDRFLVDVPLILESEWGDEDAISNDFQKLLVARAHHRVMLFGAHSVVDSRSIRESLVEQIRRCRLVQASDRFMFATYREDSKDFEFAYFVAMEEQRTPLNDREDR